MYVFFIFSLFFLKIKKKARALFIKNLMSKKTFSVNDIIELLSPYEDDDVWVRDFNHSLRYEKFCKTLGVIQLDQQQKFEMPQQEHHLLVFVKPESTGILNAIGSWIFQESWMKQIKNGVINQIAKIHPSLVEKMDIVKHSDHQYYIRFNSTRLNDFSGNEKSMYGDLILIKNTTKQFLMFIPYHFLYKKHH